MKTYAFESKSFQIVYKQLEKHVYIEVPITEDTHGKIAKWIEIEEGEEDPYETISELSSFLGDRKQYGITSTLVEIPEFEKLYNSQRKNFILKHKDELLHGFEIIRNSELVFREVKINPISEYFYYLINIFASNFSLEEIYDFLGEIDLNLAEGLPSALIDRIWDVLFDHLRIKEVSLDEKNWARKILEILGIKGYEELVNYVRMWGVYKLDMPRIYTFYSDIPTELWDLFINNIDWHFSLIKKGGESEISCFKTFDEIRVEMLKAIETQSINLLGNFEIEEIFEKKMSFSKKFVWGLEQLFEKLELSESVKILRKKRELIKYVMELFREKIDSSKPKIKRFL